MEDLLRLSSLQTWSGDFCSQKVHWHWQKVLQMWLGQVMEHISLDTSTIFNNLQQSSTIFNNLQQLLPLLKGYSLTASTSPFAALHPKRSLWQLPLVGAIGYCIGIFAGQS